MAFVRYGFFAKIKRWFALRHRNRVVCYFTEDQYDFLLNCQRDLSDHVFFCSLSDIVATCVDHCMNCQTCVKKE